MRRKTTEENLRTIDNLLVFIVANFSLSAVGLACLPFIKAKMIGAWGTYALMAITWVAVFSVLWPRRHKW